MRFMASLIAVLASMLSATPLAHAERSTTAPRAANAALQTIRISRVAVTRIGAYRPWRDPTIAGAERVFGPSSHREVGRYGGCRVDWRRLGLRIVFEKLGGPDPGESTCVGTVGKAQLVRVRGRGFRTWKGLRVGHRSATITERHPNAQFDDDSWWLATAERGPEDDEYGVLRALVSDGRVTMISGWIGAAGHFV
jgi:hypothetical protein